MTIVIQEQVNLLPYNTFHFSCTAKYFVEVKTPHDIQELIQHPVYINTPQKLILWWWSNMLFATDSFDGLLIKNSITGKKLIHEYDEEVVVDIGSWEIRNDFVWRSINQWRSWGENLVSIPWTIGAAPVQNIWAYGVEAKDIIIWVTWIDMQTGESKSLSHGDCLFWYRNSIFKSTFKANFMITSVQFRLAVYNQKQYIWNVNYEGVAESTQEIQEKHPEKTRVRCIATAIAQIRASKLPDVSKIGTAWSFFQNPVISTATFQQLQTKYPTLKWWTLPNDMIKLSAGQLIELAWFKGHTQNNVGVYEHHALVLVHHGNSKGAYLLDVITLIQHKVQELFTVQLVPEVIIISSHDSIWENKL